MRTLGKYFMVIMLIGILVISGSISQAATCTPCDSLYQFMLDLPYVTYVMDKFPSKEEKDSTLTLAIDRYAFDLVSISDQMIYYQGTNLIRGWVSRGTKDEEFKDLLLDLGMLCPIFLGKSP